MPDVQTRRDAKLPSGRLAVTPRSYDPEAHTVELVAATGYPVRRYDWEVGTYYFEKLQIDDKSIDASRVDQGVCPLLDVHSSWAMTDQLGSVRAWRVEKGALILQVQFGTSTAALEAESQVAGGHWRGVSVGYVRNEMLKEQRQDGALPTYTVTSWTLSEVSLVPIPADPASGVRSEEDGFHPCILIETRKEPVAMSPENPTTADPAAPDTRAAPAVAPAAPAAPAADPTAVRMTASEALDFATDGRSFGIEDAQVRTWVTDLTPDAARSAMLRKAGEIQRAAAPVVPARHVVTVQDERDVARMAIASALLHRHAPATHKLHDAGREYRGMSLLEICRRNLQNNGEKVSGLGKRELADLALRAHSTSDFPNILASVTGRTLRDGYAASPQTFKVWMRRASLPDFRQIARLQLGGAPSFLLVPEGGEYKMGTIGEGKEVYSLATYGRKFAITRQVIINDDVDAFTRIPEMMGRAAADFESDAAYAPLITNPNMGDGAALFSTGAGNQAASGAAISESTYQAGEIAMGSQVGIEGRPINLGPRWVITAVKDKVPAMKLRGSTVSQKSGDATGTVNVYENAFDIVVEARLNRASGATPWFMAADYAQVDTLEYAYLDGDDGVFLDERMGFDVDGIEYKARLDFGVKAIDRKGLFQNPGT